MGRSSTPAHRRNCRYDDSSPQGWGRYGRQPNLDPFVGDCRIACLSPAYTGHVGPALQSIGGGLANNPC